MILEESFPPAGRLPDRIGLTSQSEITAFATAVRATLLRYQDLVAAARAALAADHDGEPDPLYYLRDELEAQGQLHGHERRPR